MRTPPHPNQFGLLRQRRFAPYFWTQFLGAGNDNLFKFAFTVLVTYQLQLHWLPATMAGLVIGALFTAPFLLFSATSGQLADKYDKALLMRRLKNLEIAILLMAAWAFWATQVVALLGAVFLMGLHSTLFGPVKYAYLPQHLNEQELVGGNGMVEMGTFVAILMGQVCGGLLMALPAPWGPHTVAVSCVVVALLGRWAAGFIPATPAADPELKICWNPFTETLRNLRMAWQSPVVFRSLLGISWMWFFGAVFLTQFPAFAKDILHGDEAVASLLMAVFSLGIGVGALLCETLGRRHVEIGLVPLGALGMSLFALDLVAALPSPVGAGSASTWMGLGAFLQQPGHYRVMADLMGLALSAGLYSVPMYALIQIRTPATHRARVIAANNILNALFMILSAVWAGAWLYAGASVPEVFAATAVLNAGVTLYIFWLVPEYLLRFIAFLITRVMYRYRVIGQDQLPAQGAAVLICNHVTYVDALLILSASPRPVRFLMDHQIFQWPVLGALFRLAKAIPIAPKAEDPDRYEAAFETARAALAAGECVALFPEGALTRTGEMAPFKAGVMKLLAAGPAGPAAPAIPVYPMALHNFWGSTFSRIEGRALKSPFRRGVRSRVSLRVGPALPPSACHPAGMQAAVAALLAAPEGP